MQSYKLYFLFFFFQKTIQMENRYHTTQYVYFLKNYRKKKVRRNNNNRVIITAAETIGGVGRLFYVRSLGIFLARSLDVGRSHHIITGTYPRFFRCRNKCISENFGRSASLRFQHSAMISYISRGQLGGGSTYLCLPLARYMWLAFSTTCSLVSSASG